MIEYLSANWINILLVLVGLSAFGVYFTQKRDHRRSAATLIKEQIDSIEKSISLLRNDKDLGNVSIYRINPIMRENLWEKYRHLFVRTLSSSEMNLVQEFYDSAEQIERARQDIIKVIENAWTHKSLVGHLKYADFINESLGKVSEQPQTKIDYFRERFDPLNTEFTPGVIVDVITRNMMYFKALSGTSAYKKIEKIAYDK